jgi:prepilin-type N-terminal cleavage/methylation domain-containing protein
MRRENENPKRLKGFTLIELLVVVAIIALLISILLPSHSRARKEAQTVSCMSNTDQINKALRMYMNDFGGCLPQSYREGNNYQPGSLWSEAAWGVAKRDLWFYKIAPKYLSNPAALICPADPFRDKFDFEATPEGGLPRTAINVPSCGYGLTYVLRHFDVSGVPGGMMNIERHEPRSPSMTILMAEVGPDDAKHIAPLYSKAASDYGDGGWPWRDGGRLLWDDGVRGWYNGPTWLTGRHMGYINMGTFDLSARKVSTVKQLRDGPQRRNMECFSFTLSNYRYMCYLCAVNEPHYQFHEQNLWWWTGDIMEAR